MDILIKNATIVHPGDRLHLLKKDILISKGRIQSIANSISAPKAKKIESNDLHVSIGWMDIGTHIGEPGLEHRETIESASRAAASGGYTDIVVMPTVDPITESKSQVSYLHHQQPANGVKMHTIGAVSKGAHGEDLTEMIDMARSGAVAFGDGMRSIQDSGMMMRALQYAKAVDKPIINHALDKALAHDGHLHEGSISVSLGIQGVPALAEHTAVMRDIHLTEYTDSKLILHCISSEQSAKMVKKAQSDQIKVQATVSYMNLLHTEEDLKDFDSNLKVKPPLRSAQDRKGLIKNLKKGTIQAIVSNHVPLEEEKKKLEFSYASYGAIGLETAYAAMNTALKDKLDITHIIKALSIGPRTLLDMDIPKIKVDQEACLTLFDPTVEWSYIASKRKSTSSNSPYLGQAFIGKVIATISGSKVNTAE